MKKKNSSNFETDLAQLEKVVEQIDDAQTPLDTAISLYKEGLALVAKCGKTLHSYENEVFTLQKNLQNNEDATFILAPFGDS